MFAVPIGVHVKRESCVLMTKSSVKVAENREEVVFWRVVDCCPGRSHRTSGLPPPQPHLLVNKQL